MTNAKKLTWRELRELNPKAFEAHMESVLDYIEESDSLTLEEKDGKLYSDGCYPGDEYGGGCRCVFTGEYFEEDESAYDGDDEEQDDEEE